MNNVSLNSLRKPLRGASLTSVLTTGVVTMRAVTMCAAAMCVATAAASADDVLHGGGDTDSGGGGAPHAGESHFGGSPPFLPVEAPPPGTLGRTYSLPSRPVPANRHPRIGMIDVCTDEAVHVIVRWTNDFRNEETLKGSRDECNPSLWHFESKPLLPGLTQIYRVEVYRGEAGSAPSEVRYVRLVRGRIVYLNV